jgi:molybdenum cofactor cytidylyltransferase
MQPVAAIVLAAGAATRMGQSKQLLLFQGKALIEHAIAQVIDARLRPVIVVVGAQAQAVRKSISVLPVEIVYNENWPAGMGSSLTTGLARLQQIEPDAAATAIVLADQPLVSAKHLSEMRELLAAKDKNIVAAQYNGALGVPAFFKRELFPQLASLPPDSGARRILRGETAQVVAYCLPEAAIDIDTPDDYAALKDSSRI